MSTPARRESVLIHLPAALEALARATTFPEIKKIREMAAAAEQYATAMRLGDQAVLDAGEVRLRAERKMGEALAAMPKAEGAKMKPGGNKPLPPGPQATLEEIGITKMESSRAQKMSPASIPDKEFEQAIQEGRKKGRLTEAGVLRKKREREVRQRHAQETAPEAPERKYACFVVDPPWPMEKIERDARPNQPSVIDYPSMTLEEIEAFTVVRDSAATDAHLYLWVTHKHLPAAFVIARAWGFKYQCLMTWCKNVGFTPFSWMYSTEHALFCTRGSLKMKKLGLRLNFDGKVREHSRKPEEFYDRVREASPGPRLDVFSREQRDGFDTWGNESERFEKVRD